MQALRASAIAVPFVALAVLIAVLSVVVGVPRDADGRADPGPGGGLFVTVGRSIY